MWRGALQTPGRPFGVYDFPPLCPWKLAIWYTPKLFCDLLRHFISQNWEHLWCILLSLQLLVPEISERTVLSASGAPQFPQSCLFNLPAAQATLHLRSRTTVCLPSLSLPTLQKLVGEIFLALCRQLRVRNSARIYREMFGPAKMGPEFLDDGQIAHLICVRLNYLLYDSFFVGGRVLAFLLLSSRLIMFFTRNFGTQQHF